MIRDPVEGKNRLNSVPLALIANANSLKERPRKWYVNAEERNEYPMRIFFIQDPGERLQLAWRHLKFLHLRGRSPYPVNVDLDTYVKFIDFVLEGDHEDFEPQVNSRLYSGQLKPTHVFRFEDRRIWWPNFESARLNKIESAPDRATSNYRLIDLSQKYNEDIQARKLAALWKAGDPVWPSL